MTKRTQMTTTLDLQFWQQPDGRYIISNFDYINGDDIHIVMVDNCFYLEDTEGNLQPISLGRLLILMLENDKDKINEFRKSVGVL